MSISDFATQNAGEPQWQTENTETVTQETAPETVPIATEQTVTAPTSDGTSTPTTQTPQPTTQQPVAQQPVAQTAPVVDEILNTLLGNMHDIGVKTNFKILIYGDPGTTKSSFIATAPNNLIVDLDEGLISAKTSPHGIAQNVKAFPWQGFTWLDALIAKLAERPPALDWVEVLSIDPFSETHKRGLDEVLQREYNKAPSTFNRFTAETEHHAENNNRMLAIVRALKDLDRNLIITAHARTVEPKGKPAKTYPDFSESLANKIEGMMDLVGYMTRKDNGEGQMVPVLRVHTEGTIHAKTRLPLPVEILNPTYPQIKAVWEQLVAQENA